MGQPPPLEQGVREGVVFALPPEEASTDLWTEAPRLGERGYEEGRGQSGRDIEAGYYLLIKGRRMGPYPEADLVRAGLDHNTLVWWPGARGWRQARSVRELRDVLRFVPPPPLANTPWAHPAFLPRPQSLHTLYWWYFWMTMAMLFFLLMMATFLILYENVREQNPWGPAFGGRRYPAFEMLAIFAGMTALGCAIAAVVLSLFLLFQMWKVVQDGHAAATPPAAVGFLFIPFFNLFWIFVALMGLARELGRIAQERGYTARPAPVGLALGMCICLLIPYVNLITAIPLGLITFGMLRNTAADIVEARLAEESPEGD